MNKYEEFVKILVNPDSVKDEMNQFCQLNNIKRIDTRGSDIQQVISSVHAVVQRELLQFLKNKAESKDVQESINSALDFRVIGIKPDNTVIKYVPTTEPGCAEYNDFVNDLAKHLTKNTYEKAINLTKDISVDVMNAERKGGRSVTDNNS